MREFILLRRGFFLLLHILSISCGLSLERPVEFNFLKDGLYGAIWFLNNQSLVSYWQTSSVTHRFLVMGFVCFVLWVAGGLRYIHMIYMLNSIKCCCICKWTYFVFPSINEVLVYHGNTNANIGSWWVGIRLDISLTSKQPNTGIVNHELGLEWDASLKLNTCIAFLQVEINFIIEGVMMIYSTHKL